MKQTLRAADYTFTPGTKQIAFGLAGFDVRGLLAIVNQTAKADIYQIGDPALGYTSVSGSTVTLQFDTSGMSASDALIVFYDSGAAAQAVSLAALPPLVAGTATIGAVTQAGGPWTVSWSGQAVQSDLRVGGASVAANNAVPVTVGNFPATQAVSGSVTVSWSGQTVAADLRVAGAAVASGNPVPVSVGNFPATQPVSGTVGLAAGANTIGSVGNAFLLDATFTGRINTLGQKTSANSTPVVLASDQSSIPVAATLQAGSAAIGSITNAFALDATLTARLGTLGQKTAAGSAPVVLASDQASIPVAATLQTGSNVIGTVNTNPVQRATITEGGGTTSSTVSTATTVVSADAARKKFEFQNLGSAVIYLRINQGADTTAAAASSTTKRMIAVPAGQLYVTEPDTLCTGLVSVLSATASVPYSYLAS